MRVFLLLLAAFQLGSSQVPSQISGTVSDPSGATVGEASITVTNLGSGVRRTATTATDGTFGISSLPAGEYKVMVRKHGFRTMARLGVKLSMGQAAQVDFDLGIGGMKEVVTIEGGRSTINTEDATSGIVIDRDTAERLPVSGRTLQGLVSFAPGVVVTPATQGEAGQFSVNGQRPNANYFVVDGVSMNSGVSGSGVPGQFSGGTLPAMTAIGSLHALASPAEVHEVRVQTSTYAPEFGRMPGAQVQVSTRAGSNELHGQAFYASRHERLSASDTFSNRAGLAAAPLRLHDVNLSLGGPLRANRTFFFASAEVLRLRQPAAWRMAVPSQAAREVASPTLQRVLDAFPSAQRSLSELFGETTVQTSWPARLTTGSFRIDHAVGSQGAFFARYNEAPSSNRMGFLQSNQSEYRTRSLTAGYSSAHDGSILNDARVNVSNTSVRSFWLAGRIDANSLSALLLPPGSPGQWNIYGVSIGGLGQLVAGSGESKSSQGQFQIIDTVAIGSGRHQVRLGVDYQRLTPSRERPVSSIAGRFASLQDLFAGARPEFASAVAPGGSSLIETLSAFAQDTWSVNARLNLTYGIRWEYMPPPAARIDTRTQTPVVTLPVTPPLVPPGTPPDRDLGVPATPGLPPTNNSPAMLSEPGWKSRRGRFAPRGGLAYRLNEAGDFVLRAGVGVFYDLGFASAIDPLNGAPFNSWRTYSLISPTESAIFYGFSPDLTIPYSTEWNVTLEKGLGGEGILSTAWVGSHGRRLLRREGYLQPETNLAKLLVATTNGRSDYHSFQVHYRRSLSRDLRGLASYTWSHSTDNGSWDSGSYLVIPGSQDRGPSNFDVRHSFSAGFSYALPKRVFRDFGNGWSLNTIVRARTGFPVDLLAQENAFGLAFDNAPRPDLVPGVPVWITDLAVPGGRRLNPAAFQAPASGTGTLGRNAVRGFGLWQADASVERRFNLRNDSTLHVRLQVYNLTNTPALGDPVRVLSSSLFGQPISTMGMMLGTGRPGSGLTPAFQMGGPRTVELSLSWKF
jgi:hypothetical protein